AAAIAFIAAFAFIGLAAIDLRLRSGDEGGQAIDAAIVRRHRLWLRLRLRRVLRLRTLAAVLAISAVLARLLLVTLIGLLVVALMLAPATVAIVAHIRLRLLRNEAGLLAEARIILALVLAFVACDLIGARLRLVLAELLLGGGDQAEIVLGVLVVVFGGHGVAGGPRVAGELQIFLGDVRGCAADLDVGPVRFEHPG